MMREHCETKGLIKVGVILSGTALQAERRISL